MIIDIKKAYLQPLYPVQSHITIHVPTPFGQVQASHKYIEATRKYLPSQYIDDTVVTPIRTQSEPHHDCPEQILHRGPVQSQTR